MFERVLLMTDVTDKPELTYGPVSVISRTCASKGHLFHAIRGSSDLFYLQGEAAKVLGLIDEQAKARVEPVLEEIATDLRERGVDVEIITWIGSTFDVAVRAIEELNIDLVILPQEGYADFTARILNSTTARIMRETKVPLLTCNASFGEHKDSWVDFQKIILPVDLNADARTGLESAEIFAERFGGSLELVHVVTPIHQQLLDTPEGDILLPKDMYYKIKTRLEARLSNKAHEVCRVPAAWQLIEDTKPGSGVMAYADRSGADLIIIPPVGGSSVRSTVLGSVAEHVIKHARCPVLTLRAGAFS